MPHPDQPERRREVAAAFHALHHREQPLLLPNAWDFASGAALAQAGFPAIGTTSLGVAAGHGLPDGEGRTRTLTVALARQLTRLPLPVTVDIEAGFSTDPARVGELAAELAGIGVAGINLEDGRPTGVLAHPERQAELIRAVTRRAPGLFVNARVDTYWQAGGDPPSLTETIDRAQRYVAAGADGIFVPGVNAVDAIARLVAAIPAPLNVLYQPSGPSIAALAAAGVGRISTGSLLFRTALGAAVTAATQIRDDQPTLGQPIPYQLVQQLTDAPR